MLKLLSLFSGIGAFEKALENLDEPFQVVRYCEIDRYASKAYSLIHNIDENMNLKDVTTVDTSVLPADIDIITYGFPCQDISHAGKQKGFIDADGDLTRSGLFFEALRIIEDLQPKIAIAENVKALAGKKFTAEFKIVLDSLNDAGYTNYWAVLNSKDYGIPQTRDRIFIISIRNDIDHGFQFPKKYELKLRLKDLLEETVDEKYYLDDKFVEKIMELNALRPQKDSTNINVAFNLFEAGIKGFNRDMGEIMWPTGVCKTLQTMQGGNRQPKIFDGKRIRKLTPKECFRVMGFDDHDCYVLCQHGISNSQLYKLAGNSIVVDVLEEIFVELLNQYDDVFPCQA